jgi:plasmid stability protein
MAQVIVRNIDDGVKAGLKARAAAHGWSMEEEVRQILRCALTDDAPARIRLGSKIAERFAKSGLQQVLPELRGHAVVPMDLGP